ncbi:hypothetical protein PC121_g13335 [Phytophthora cactorum]|nr:hypothetical protein PC121_g13335 [Phytophthora cactorum]
MEFTNKDLYYLLFTELSPNQARCNTCINVFKSGNGYTNQVHHLLKRHPDYQELAAAVFRKGNRFGVTLPDQRTCEVFRWVEWCIRDRMPVSFCERPLVRKNAKMEPISAATLQKYLDALYGLVREVTATTLPDKFGIVLDALTTGGRHYFAIMAVFDDPSAAQPKQRHLNYDESIQCLTRRFVLLAFCPLGDEEDLSTQSLVDLIDDTLSTYNWPWESVRFMTGDNCSVNQAIGRKVGALPFIGCASHRFQFALNDFLADKELLLAKFHVLMKHLSTIKCRAALRKVMPLAPVLRNVTRWSSTFNMVQRDEESVHVEELLVTLMDLNEVTKALQVSTLAMVATVNYPALESGSIKIISGSRLTTREQKTCKAFKRPTTNATVEETSRSFFAPVFQKASEPRTFYIPLAWVPPTLNECERFFSQVKLVFTDLRKSMEVNTLEVPMFLAYNKDSWNVGGVQAIRRKMRK